MAHALEDDERCDPERAALHYRRSLQLDPNNTDCLCDYGRLALRMGHAKEGLKCLRRAVELSPNDPHAVECLAQELTQIDQMEEARTALAAALFRNPRDHRFRKLWNDHQFQELRRAQEAARCHSGASRTDDEPVLLPFVRLVTEAKPTCSGHKIVRCDAPSPTPPPKVPQSTRSAKHRHAQ